jgi:hypothetical protein
MKNGQVESTAIPHLRRTLFAVFLIQLKCKIPEKDIVEWAKESEICRGYYLAGLANNEGFKNELIQICEDHGYKSAIVNWILSIFRNL